MVPHAVICFAFLALSSQPFLANAADLIAQTCEKTLYKDVCKSEFAAVPQSKSADLEGLAKIAFDLAEKQANAVHDKIQDLSSSKGEAMDDLTTAKDDKIHQRLNDCSENYQDAVDQFEDSRQSLSSKNYQDVNTWITGAMSDAKSCEDGFKEVSDKPSQLMELNQKFNSLCSIFLSIVDLLDGKA